MIPTFRPTIRRADMDAVLTRLAEDSIGTGTVSQEFSQNVAKTIGKRSGVSVRSYGHAVLAAFRALDLPPGSRIGLSVLAPISVFNMVYEAGLLPVPIDVDRQLPVLPSPLDFDYETLELSAIYVDTRLGYVADLENFKQLRIPVIEDISEGIGGHTGDSVVGSIGEMSVLAMEAEHIITAGGGAVVMSNNTRRVSALTAMVDHRIGEPPLPDMNAALGITQLKQLDSFIERRRDIASRFVRTVQRGRYRVPFQGGDGENVFFTFPVMIDSSPREVEKYARGHGVSVQRAFLDVVYATLDETDRFPNGLLFSSQMVLFPLYPTLGKSEQERIERVLATLP